MCCSTYYYYCVKALQVVGTVIECGLKYQAVMQDFIMNISCPPSFIVFSLDRTCVPNREYCQQKTKKVLLINGGVNYTDVLFWSSAPRSFIRLLSRFSNPTWMPWQHSLLGTLDRTTKCSSTPFFVEQWFCSSLGLQSITWIGKFFKLVLDGVQFSYHSTALIPVSV